MNISKLLFFSICFIIACSPKVYVIDRQTVLHESAAGEWPEFEKTLVNKVKPKGPVTFNNQITGGTINSESEKRRGLYKVLNGDMRLLSSRDEKRIEQIKIEKDKTINNQTKTKEESLPSMEIKK